MSLNEEIRRVITPIVPVCDPDYYGGEEETYCTFGYSEYPDLYGDDGPCAYRCAVDLHLFMPRGKNSVDLRRKIRRAIMGVSTWTAPTITNAFDDIGQHFVFEFDAIGEL